MGKYIQLCAHVFVYYCAFVCVHGCMSVTHHVRMCVNTYICWLPCVCAYVCPLSYSHASFFHIYIYNLTYMLGKSFYINMPGIKSFSLFSRRFRKLLPQQFAGRKSRAATLRKKTWSKNFLVSLREGSAFKMLREICIDCFIVSLCPSTQSLNTSWCGW